MSIFQWRVMLKVIYFFTKGTSSGMPDSSEVFLLISRCIFSTVYKTGKIHDLHLLLYDKVTGLVNDVIS